jgi:DDE superfamily endonuclease
MRFHGVFLGNQHEIWSKQHNGKVRFLLYLFGGMSKNTHLGYLGIQADYRGDQIEIPVKKPRKSKKNPNPQLSAVQKAANTALSQVRIFVEHAIGGMKRYNILVHGFRNHKAHFEGDVIGVCAGLWNFVLSYCGTTLLGPSVTCHSDPEGVVMVVLNGLRLPQSAEVMDINMRPLSNCWRDSDIELYKQWVGSS